MKVALRSALGLRPNPIPAPQKTSPCYAASAASLLRTERTSCARRPRSARGGLLGGAPFPLLGEGGLGKKPCYPGRALSHGRRKLPAVVRVCASPCPSPSARQRCSSLLTAVAYGAVPLQLPRPVKSQVSQFPFGGNRSGKEGERKRSALLPHPR